MKYENKTVWITGASSGIGKATAQEFAKEGATLILSSRNKESLQALRNELPNPNNVFVLPLDLAKSEDMQSKVDEALRMVSKIDVVVHSGGISQRSLAIDTSMEVNRHVMEIDYFGTIALTLAVLPHFVKNQSGQFVVITSLMGVFSSPMRSGYCGAKHALHGYFDALRAEHQKDNITVTIVCPGFIRTNISKNAMIGTGEKQGTMDEATGAGMSAEACARKLVQGTSKQKAEIYIGGKEILAVYIKRFFPSLLRRMITKVKVT
ncbi:MAG: SDR family oxidoreductase [Flavobacteriales bacterium]|nr:SDR family oxidoreductase [Flavobacteriales bacterium]